MRCWLLRVPSHLPCQRSPADVWHHHPLAAVTAHDGHASPPFSSFMPRRRIEEEVDAVMWLFWGLVCQVCLLARALIHGHTHRQQARQGSPSLFSSWLHDHLLSMHASARNVYPHPFFFLKSGFFQHSSAHEAEMFCFTRIWHVLFCFQAFFVCLFAVLKAAAWVFISTTTTISSNSSIRLWNVLCAAVSHSCSLGIQWS